MHAILPPKRTHSLTPILGSRMCCALAWHALPEPLLTACKLHALASSVAPSPSGGPEEPVRAEPAPPAGAWLA
eukprot:4953781-Alexandrium_andersonii.AAC.1